MTNYADQRSKVAKLATELNLPVLRDAVNTIEKAEKDHRLLEEIYICAHHNREFCIHCDSIVKVIEDSRA